MMSRRYSIRTLFIATFVVAVFVIGVSKFLPYVNDSWFVSRCLDHQGATFYEFQQFATGMGRDIEETYDGNNNTVIGFKVRALDGRVIYLLMSDSDQLSSKIDGHNNWDEIRISSVHTYEVLKETSAGLILSRTSTSTPISGR